MLAAAIPADAIIVSDLQSCQKAISKAGPKYVAGVLKTMGRCRDRELAAAPTNACTETDSTDRLAKASAKMRASIDKACGELGRLQLELPRPLGLGLGADLNCSPGSQECEISSSQQFTHELAAHTVLRHLYGSTTASSGLGASSRKCQAQLTSSASKLLRSVFKSLDKRCMAQFDRGRDVVDAPLRAIRECAQNEELVAAIAKADAKLRAKNSGRCNDQQIAELDLCRQGPGQITSVIQANECLSVATIEVAEGLISLQRGQRGASRKGIVTLDVSTPESRRVELAGIAVYLRDDEVMMPVAFAETDAFGAVHFNDPPFGTYSVCFATAEDTSCATEPVHVDLHPDALGEIRLAPPVAHAPGTCQGGLANGQACSATSHCPGGFCDGAALVGTIHGRVAQIGGRPCHFVDSFRDADTRATVVAKSASGQVLAGPVLVNADGEYVLTGVPAAAVALEATCGDAVVVSALSGSGDLIGAAPFDFTISNSDPIIDDLVVLVNGQKVFPTFDAGANDDFGLPADAATPRKEIVSAFPMLKGFDEGGSGLAAHTFSGYSTMLCGAKLEFEVRAETGPHSGDLLLLDFDDAGTGSWHYALPLSELPEMQESGWNDGDKRNVLLNLASLPNAGGQDGVANVLERLTDGVFDIGVDGNVAIDSASLTVARCVFTGDSVDIEAFYSDADGDDVVVSWADHPGATITPLAGGSQGAGLHRAVDSRVDWSPAGAGIQHIRMLADDGSGGQAKASLLVAVLDLPSIDLSHFICIEELIGGCRLSSGVHNPTDGSANRNLVGDEFLTRKGTGTEVESCIYYNLVDPACQDLDCDGAVDAGVDSRISDECSRLTMGDWWDVNGFDPLDGSGGDAAGYYLNKNDLGFGREMHCNITGFGSPLGNRIVGHFEVRDRFGGSFTGVPLLIPNHVACYVSNYSTNCIDLANNDPRNANLAAEADPDNVIATVAMEYSPVEFFEHLGSMVKFFVYARGGQQVDLHEAPRQFAADLDGCGVKYVPQLCQNCHGGDYPEISYEDETTPSFDPDDMPEFIEDLVGTDTLGGLDQFVDWVGDFPVSPLPNGVDGQVPARDRSILLQSIQDNPSSFLPFDTDTYDFPTLAGFSETDQHDEFRELNRIVRSTQPEQAIKDLINGWYGGFGLSGTFDETWTDSAWTGSAGSGLDYADLYNDVYARSCRGCHAAHTGLTFDDPTTDYPFSAASSFRSRVCEPSSAPMPHARLTYENLFREEDPQEPTLGTIETWIGGTCP
jgi:hypothetical protein